MSASNRVLTAFAAFAIFNPTAFADLIQVDVKFKPADAVWISRPTQILPRLDGYAPKGPRPLSRYGGWAEAKVGATGFFQVRKVGERWWLVDPDGHLYLSKGVASVAPGGSARTKTAFASAFGTTSRWADSTAALMRSWGLNSVGAWSSGNALSQAKAPVAYAPVWNFMSGYGARRGGITQQAGHTGYPNDGIFVFDPGFEAFCDEHARQLAALKDDPWLLGHFSDNELPWPVDALKKYLALSAVEPGRLAAQAWLDARKGKPSGASEVTLADEEAFRYYQSDRYFSIVSRAIRKYDPNHLYLGSRFHGRALGDSMVVKAAGKHLEAIAFNWYNSWTPDAARMANWEKWSGKPFLITEWYAKGADAVGLANTSGAGWLVKTQSDRGHFYQNFTLALLRSKASLGWHWFKYQDNDPEDGSTDPSNRDANKGVIDIFYKPYPELASAMKEINTEAYSLTEFFDGRIWTGVRQPILGTARDGAALFVRSNSGRFLHFTAPGIPGSYLFNPLGRRAEAMVSAIPIPAE